MALLVASCTTTMATQFSKISATEWQDFFRFKAFGKTAATHISVLLQTQIALRMLDQCNDNNIQKLVYNGNAKSADFTNRFVKKV